MIRQTVLFISVSLLTTITHPAIANSDPFLEQNGRLIVELEAETVSGDWLVQNSLYGYTGASYFVWNGKNNYAKSEAPRGNPIQYHIRIDTPGNYEFRWRSRNTVGDEATEHNDSWVRFPTGKNIEGEHFLDGWTKAYMGHVQQWTWDTHTVDNDNKPIRQYFDAGDHYIDIAGRSNGHGLDRFALYRYNIEEFNIGEFETLAPSPKASEADQPRHTYVGNTCVANTLSLAANNRDANDPISDIHLTDMEQTALLRFDIPEVQKNQISLKLSSTQSSLALSAYLGSHSDWTNNTPEQDLPYASTLLGTLLSDTAQDRIEQLDLNDMPFTAGPLTILLQPVNGLSQNLYGISTALEPRLDIHVPQDFCVTYQAIRSGLQPQLGNEQNQSNNENTDQDIEIENGTDTGTETETNTDTDTDTGTGTGTGTDTGTDVPSNNPSPFEVVDSRTDDGTDTQPVQATKKRSGSLSGLTLSGLFFTACLYRIRKKHLCAIETQ